MGETIINKYGYPYGPGCKAFAIVKDDATDQLAIGNVGESNAFQVYVGTTGNVAVIAALDSSAITFVGVPAGATLPILVKRVMSTNTTASNMVGIY